MDNLVAQDSGQAIGGVVKGGELANGIPDARQWLGRILHLTELFRRLARRIASFTGSDGS
jgi:hypothetical protein